MSAQLDTLVVAENLRRELEGRGVKWPLGGFAPGLYMGRCTECGEVFMVAKGSIRCLPCAVVTVRTHHAELVRMHNDLIAIVASREAVVGVTDPTDWRYPTWCTAARSRLSSLREGIDAIAPQVTVLEGYHFR